MFDAPSVTFLLYDVVTAILDDSSYVLLVAPEISDQVLPALIDFCH